MKSIAAAVLLGLCVSTASAAPAIPIEQARKIALDRVPGTIMHEKLKHAEKPHGKHAAPTAAHDHYNIKIRPKDHPKADRWKRVEVDATTGQILEVKDVKAKSYD